MRQFFQTTYKCCLRGAWHLLSECIPKEEQFLNIESVYIHGIAWPETTLDDGTDGIW